MTYTYKCEDCDKEFEIEKGINDDIEIKCECGSKNVKRIFSIPFFKNNLNDCCGKIGK